MLQTTVFGDEEITQHIVSTRFERSASADAMLSYDSPTPTLHQNTNPISMRGRTNDPSDNDRTGNGGETIPITDTNERVTPSYHALTHFSTHRGLGALPPMTPVASSSDALIARSSAAGDMVPAESPEEILMTRARKFCTGNTDETLPDTVARYDMSTPQAGSPSTMVPLQNGPETEDFNLADLAELGQAISRGSDEVQSAAASRCASAAQSQRASPRALRKVTDESPHALIAMMQPSTAATGTMANPTAGPSTVDQIVDTGVEMAFTAASSATFGTAGSMIGEMVGGDMAAQTVGEFTRPAGSFAGKYFGGTVGALAGAAAIRCSSRAKPLSQPPASIEQPRSVSNRSSHAGSMVSSGANISRLEQQLALNAQTSENQMNKLATMIGQMGQGLTQMGEMFQSAHKESQKKMEETSANVAAMQLRMNVHEKNLSDGQDTITELVMETRSEAASQVTDLRQETAANFAAMEAKLMNFMKLQSSQPTNDQGNSLPVDTGARSSASGSINVDPSQTPQTQQPAPHVTFDRDIPDHEDDGAVLQCAYCNEDVLCVAAKDCRHCELHFHFRCYAKHSREWPCPKLDECDWCGQLARADEPMRECGICSSSFHLRCHGQHLPCPDKWIEKRQRDHIEPRALGRDFQRANPLTATFSQNVGYPSSPQTLPPGLPVHDDGRAAAGLGPAGHAIQLCKPRTATSLKFRPFPKPGQNFEAWQNYARRLVSSATTYKAQCYDWILECEDPAATFESLEDPGQFIDLDNMIYAACDECIPGDTHRLRQKVDLKNQELKELRKLMSGRQLLWMMYQHFIVTDKDRNLTDTAKLQSLSLKDGDLQQFIFKWDLQLTRTLKRPTDEDLLNLILIQLETCLKKDHEFYQEYYFWTLLPETNPVRNYAGLTEMIHAWVDRKTSSKMRHEALKGQGVSIPGVNYIYPVNESKIGRDSKEQTCFSWRDHGKCSKFEAGTCQYKHPKDQKGKGKADKSKGKDKGKGKDGKNKQGDGKRRSTSAPPRTTSTRTASPRRPAVTDMGKVCRLYLKNSCTKGANCKYHHNDPCKFLAAGKCTKGDDCPFPHWNVPNIAAATTTSPLSNAPGANGSGADNP